MSLQFDTICKSLSSLPVIDRRELEERIGKAVVQLMQRTDEAGMLKHYGHVASEAEDLRDMVEGKLTRLIALAQNAIAPDVSVSIKVEYHHSK